MAKDKIYSKDHVNHWKNRLFHLAYTTEVDGVRQTIKQTDLAVRIQYGKSRKSFSLGTPNQIAAATIARDIWQSLVSNGWNKTLAKYKPEMVKITTTTVGELIEEVRTKSGISLKTVEIYAKKFRTLVAGVMKIPSDNRKHDHTTGGYQKWLTRVNSVKLDKVTPEKVQVWKISYIKEHGKNPLMTKEAKSTVNSIIRSAKALFSEKALKHVTIERPERLPFDGIEFEKAGKSRYKSEMTGKLNPELLLRAAKNELSKEQPEAYLIFLLAIGAGLRRDEIDTLTWDQVIDERLTIRVETNAYTEAKSPESEEEVDVDPKIMEELRSYKTDYSNSVFVLNSKVQPKPSVSSYHHYRCTRHFNNLTKWLRKKGLKNKNVIHSLRKEFGSHIAKEKGIFAASVALRHANIGITRDHYLDKKERATFPIGQMLQDSELKVASK